MILVTGSTGIIRSALIEELAASHPLAHPPRTNKQRYERVPSEKAGAHTGAPTAKDEKHCVINAIPSHWGPS
jgi:uncharacterized protein YbjT (DUF2867 family)